MPSSPKKLAISGTEDAEQTAFFAWCACAAKYGVAVADEELSYTEKGYADTHVANPVQELEWIFAVPNGGLRDKVSAARLKATGTRKGISDIMLPVARWEKHGLFIEMKKRKGGRESDEQSDFGSFVRSQGYGYALARGWEEARSIVVQYLGL